MALSLVVAIGLWLYVVTNVSPEAEQSYYSVPVVLENEGVLLDRDLMLLSGGNSTVSIRLNGNRADLNKLSTGNLSVTVDLSGINEPGEYECEYKINYPSGVSSVTVAKRLTPTVHIEVARYATKQVPVELVFTGELQKDLFLDQEGATLSTKVVTVSGPADEVDQIARAAIELDRTNLTETITGDFVYTLVNEKYEPVDVPHVQTDTGDIHLTLPVEYLKEIRLLVELVDGGGATAQENARCELETDTIWISGSREALSKIDDLTIATVNLADVDLSTGYTEEVPIKLPENLTNQSGLKEVRVKVTLKGIQAKTLTLSRDQITILNMPEGMAANIVTQRLDVTFRGPTDQIRQLTLAQIKATVDLTNYASGTPLPLTLTITGADRVAPWGNYSILVNLIPIEELPEATGTE